MFKLRGRNLAHFGAFKDHIAFFPTSSVRLAFKEELSSYKDGPGTIRFPNGEPIPYSLVQKIVRFRIREVETPKKNNY
jgi:uncharacterized protein YdhG (YjbR/CyaY superfamily)